MLNRSGAGFRVQAMGAAALFAVILIVGCEPNQGKSKSKSESATPTKAVKPDAKPEAAPPKTEASPPKSETPAKPAETPAPATPAAPPTPPPTAPKPAADASSPEWGEEKPLAIEDDSAKRAMAENMIYATIRIKMEEMIDQRAELLKSGKNPADVEIRQLEGSIMRARDLLMEAGEVVEDVQPPIVQVSKPAGQ